MSRGPWVTTALVLSILVTRAPTYGQSRGVVVTGRVRSSDSTLLVGAVIEGVGLASRTTVTGRSGTDGRYTLYFPYSDRGYRVTGRLVGFRPDVRLARLGEVEYSIQVDLQLAPRVFELETLLVTDAPPGVTDPVERASVGGLDANALWRAPLAGNPGDLDELASLIPGVSLGDSGIAVLGISSSLNNTIVNGMRFGGSMLPPDALGSVRVASSSFDPSRGEFAGALTSIETRAGGEVWSGALRTRLSPQELAWADPAALLPSSRRLLVNGFLSGPIIPNRLHYFAAGQAERTARTHESLLDAPAAVIDNFGILRDTLQAFRAALTQTGIPTGSAEQRQLLAKAVGSLQLDYRLAAAATIRLLGTAEVRDEQAMGAGVLDLSTAGHRQRQSDAHLDATLTWAGRRVSLMTQLAADHDDRSFSGQTELPHGSVTVGATTETGEPAGVRTLAFGGSRGAEGTRATTSLASRTTLRWFPGSGDHDLAAGVEWRTTSADVDEVADPFGEYRFTDLNALALDRPSLFVRGLGGRHASARTQTTAFWLGDEWTVTSRFRIQGGGRVDAGRPQTTPPRNEAVEAAFGLRTDRVPHETAISPRLGFTWRSRPRPAPSSTSNNPDPNPRGHGLLSGTLPVDRLSNLLELTERNLQPWVTLSGGIGTFRSVLAPTAARLADYMTTTGLQGTPRSLRCIGNDVPSSTWTAGATPPMQCNQGSTTISSGDALPDVRGFAPGYRTPARTSFNLGIAGVHLGDWTVGGTLTSAWYTVEDRVDLNLQRIPAFQLQHEGGRPIFVPVTAIDPATGYVEAGASRIDPAFGPVEQIGMLAGGRTTELQVQLVPPSAIYRHIQLTFNYLLSHRSVPMRGYASIETDPRAITNRQTTEHQFLIDLGMRIWWFRLSAQLDLRPGDRYTPLVDGDLNGDGLANDVAYLPPRGSTNLLAQELAELRSLAPRGATRCLEEQAGGVAAPDSCRGPWRSRINLHVAFNPRRSLGLGDRLGFSIGVENAGGALQRLLGVAPDALQGGPPPDPRLLTITGFDAAAGGYTYRVNRGFGAPFDAPGRRIYPTFQVQLRAEWRLGGPRRDRIVDAMELRPPSETETWNEASARARLAALVPNPVDKTLALADTLGLSRASRDSLVAVGRATDRLLDMALAQVVQTMVERGRHLNDREMVPLLIEVQPLTEQIVAQAAAQVEKILTPFQREQLRLLLMAGSTGVGDRSP